MLTKELAVFTFDRNFAHIKPDRLKSRDHAGYVEHAEQMLRVYAEGIGKTREELHSAIRRIFADEQACPPRRIDAFCKLLDENRVAEYEKDRFNKAAALRSKVFKLAAPLHPLVERKDRLFDHVESEVKQSISRKLGYSNWEAIEYKLFADVTEYNRLLSFNGYSNPEALLRRYNVAQVQVVLFYATRLVLWAQSDFQRIVTHAKLARLLHEITPPPDNSATGEYIITLDGPASLLRETHRYGVDMAKFLPALLSCKDWRMRADIRIKRSNSCLELSWKDGLKSEMPSPDEFDSHVEEAFAKKWGQESRDGWSMKREGTLLQNRQVAFIVDFSFQHEDGRKALLEIVGFWTHEYLKKKIAKLALFEDEHIILAVAEGVAERWPNMPSNVILYKTALKLNDVLTALGQVMPSK